MLQKLQEARQTAQTISARSGKKPIFFRVEKILKSSLDSIPSASVKIQNIDGKVYLR